MDKLPKINHQQLPLIKCDVEKLETTFENLKENIYEYIKKLDVNDENQLKNHQQLNLELGGLKKWMQAITKAETEILRAIYNEKSVLYNAEIIHLKAEIQQLKANEVKQQCEIETLKAEMCNFRQVLSANNEYTTQINSKENNQQSKELFSFNSSNITPMPTSGNAYIANLKTNFLNIIKCDLNFEWKIENFISLREQELSTSPIYQINKLNLELQANLKLNAAQIIIKMRVKLLNKNKLPQALPKITLTFCYFDSQKLDNCNVSQAQEPFLGKRFKNTFKDYCFTFKLNQQLLANFTRDNQITINFAVENPLLVEIPYSTNGVLIWRVENFQEKIQSLKDELISEINSPSFYTSEDGFRVRASIINNQIYIDFLTGKFDEKNTQIVVFQIFVYLITQTQLVDLGSKMFPICDIGKSELPNSSNIYRFRKQISTHLSLNPIFNSRDTNLFDQDMFYKIVIRNV